MSRIQKFISNSASTAVLQIAMMVAGFITPRIMLQAYGSEINGLISSITQFLSYFNLVEAGLSGAAIYALYKPLADNDPKAISAVVAAARKFYMQAGYIFVALTIGLTALFPLLIHAQSVTSLEVGLLIMILGVSGALEFFTLAKYRALLTADQRMYVISLATIAHAVLNTVVIMVLAHYKVNIVLLRLVALLSIFLRSLILSTYVKLKYYYVNYSEKPNTASLNKRWDALYLQVLGAVQTGAPVLIITLILRDLKLVSVYTIFNMIIGGLGGLLSIFLSGLAASFGDVIVRGEQKTLQRAYSEFEFSYYALITVVYAVAFVTVMSFVRIYTRGITDFNYDLPRVGLLFVINGLLYNIKTPQGMLIISAGLFRETRWQSTIQGAIVVVGGVLLAPLWGIEGVLLASIVSNIYRDIDLMLYIPRHLTKLPVRQTFCRYMQIITCTLVIGVPFYYFKLQPVNYGTWVAMAAGVLVYASGVVALSNLVFNRQDLKNLRLRIRALLGADHDPVL